MAREFVKGLAGLVLLGASTLPGCGPAIIGALALDNAAHVRGRYEVRAAEIMANAQQNVAEIKVYPYELPTLEISSISEKILKYNYRKDFNDNGVIEFPEEYVGLDSPNFIEGDPIELSFTENYPVQNIKYELVNENGIVVDRFKTKSLEERNHVRLLKGNVENKKLWTMSAWHNPSENHLGYFMKLGHDKIYPEKYLGVLKPGSYVGSFYSNNELLARKDFRVIPRK